MKAFYLSLLALLLSFISFAPLTVQAAESVSVDTGKVTASLVSSHDSAAPGDTIDVALLTILDSG